MSAATSVLRAASIGAGAVTRLAVICGLGLSIFSDPTPIIRFTEVSELTGLLFTHEKGDSGQRFYVETIVAGVAVRDLDGDGHSDVYLVQGAPTPGYTAEHPLYNSLFRNRGDGSFDLVARRFGADDESYGLGVAAADYDADGFDDLYVTNLGRNRLYRNNGDGSFSDVTKAAGVGDARFGASAAWADIDVDGHLDLYVTNYLDFDYDRHKFCGDRRRNVRTYCPPDAYNAQADVLYRNRGDGTFEDISEAAGVVDVVDGKGLGVVFGDFDDDGDLDIYVANDGTRNFLYVNQGDGTFRDEALLAGVGYNEAGNAEAGMGTDLGDFDGDERLDVVVTNLDLETNTLYRNLGQDFFSDVTFATGLGEPSLKLVGFGTNWVDVDSDGDLDLFVANGHILDNITEFKRNISYEQPNHLFRNDGGHFVEIHESAGPGFQLLKVSRGSAVGDLDNDGDPDLVVSNNDESADLLRNDSTWTGNWLQVRLVGTAGNRTAAGARIHVVPVSPSISPRRIVREIRAGSSYLSTSDATEHIGVGAASAAEVVVRWPGGRTEALGVLQAGRRYVVRENSGVVAARVLAPVGDVARIPVLETQTLARISMILESRRSDKVERVVDD